MPLDTLAARLSPYATGLKLAALAVAAAVLVIVGWTANGWRLGAELASLRAEHAEQDLQGVQDDLDQFKTAGRAVAQAASEAADSVDAARARFAALKVPYAKPLPVDCRPDDERLRRRNAAIEAYNLSRIGSVSRP